jgi:leucyl-tRNA synthetase
MFGSGQNSCSDLGTLIFMNLPAKKKTLSNQGMIQGVSKFCLPDQTVHIKFVSHGLKDQYETTPLHVDVILVTNSVLDIDALREWRDEVADSEIHYGKRKICVRIRKSKSCRNPMECCTVSDTNSSLDLGTDCLAYV